VTPRNVSPPAPVVGRRAGVRAIIAGSEAAASQRVAVSRAAVRGSQNRWGRASLKALVATVESGSLIISPVVYAELGPAFEAQEGLDRFLTDFGVQMEAFTASALWAAGSAWRMLYAPPGPAGAVLAVRRPVHSCLPIVHAHHFLAATCDPRLPRRGTCRDPGGPTAHSGRGVLPALLPTAEPLHTGIRIALRCSRQPLGRWSRAAA